MSGFGVRQRRCREWGALLVAGLAGLAATSQAQAGCNNARLDLVPPGYVFNISSSPQLATTVTRADNGSCDYFIGFSDGSAANYASRRLSFGSAVVPMNVYKDAARTRILKDKPSEAVVADDVLQGSFAGGPGPDAQTLNYWAAIQPQSDYLPSGIYFESLTATLYSGKVNGSYHFESSQSLVLAYYIGRRVDLSLVDTGAPFNLNDTSQDLSFGTLSSGQSRALDLVLQYNAGFRLTFSSENNGALKHLSRSNTIPYTLQVGGLPIGLAGSAAAPVVGPSGFGTSPTGGTRFPVRVTIGSIAGAVGGPYSDTITVTVVSAE